MSKVTLSHVANIGGNPTSAATTLNNNLDAVTDALENTLSRDGTSPNQMSADLDMNSHRILNLPAPRGVTDPVRVIDLSGLTGSGTITVTASNSVMCIDAGSHDNVLVLAATIGESLPAIFHDGFEVKFTAPIIGADTIQFSGIIGSWSIRNPTGTDAVVSYSGNPLDFADIKKGSPYTLRYVSTDPYAGPAYFALVSSSNTWGELSSPLGGYTYFIVADLAGQQAVCTGKFKVYDPDARQWKYLHGQIFETLFNGTAYVDGAANQSLTAFKTYYAFAFVPPGNGHLGISGVRMNFVSRYFDYHDDVFTTSVYTATISGTTLTVSAISNGTIVVGQDVVGTNILPGTWVTAKLTGTGGTGTYTVSRSQTVSSSSMTGAHGGQYKNEHEGPYLFDSKGHLCSLIGLVYCDGTNIYSQYVRDQAIAASVYCGNVTSNQPFSLFQPQELTAWCSDAMAEAHCSSSHSPGAPISNTTEAELNVNLRTVYTAWDWRPKNTFYLQGYIQPDTPGAKVVIKVYNQPLFGATQTPVVVRTMIYHAAVANQVLPVSITCNPTVQDGAFLYSVTASINAGAAAYQLAPELTIYT